MNRIVPAMLGAVVASGFALVPTVATSQEVTIRLHTFLPPVANPVKYFMVPWAEKVEKPASRAQTTGKNIGRKSRRFRSFSE